MRGQKKDHANQRAERSRRHRKVTHAAGGDGERQIISRRPLFSWRNLIGANGDRPYTSPGGLRPEIGLPGKRVTGWVDTSAFGSKRCDARAANASQSENIIVLSMGKELSTEMVGSETFGRVRDTTGAPLPEDDLFAGLR